MAQTQQKRRRGRPAKPPGADHSVLINLPQDHYEYLVYLVSVKHRLGTTPTAAATHILVRELDKMQRTKYHEKDFPRD